MRAAVIVLCSLAASVAYPGSPQAPPLDAQGQQGQQAPSPLPVPAAESSAAPSPAASPAATRCRAVDGAAVDDSWCERSCNAALPSCPAAYCTCEGGNPTVPGAAPRTGASETNIEPPTQICTAKNYYGQKKCRNLSTEEVDQWRANEQKRHAHERESAGKARDAEELQANIERRDDMDKREADSDAVRAARDAEAEERREAMEADAERQRQEREAEAQKIQSAVAERDAAVAANAPAQSASADTPALAQEPAAVAAAPEAATPDPDWATKATRTESGAIVPPSESQGGQAKAASDALAAANAAAAEAQKAATESVAGPLLQLAYSKERGA